LLVRYKVSHYRSYNDCKII